MIAPNVFQATSSGYFGKVSGVGREAEAAVWEEDSKSIATFSSVETMQQDNTTDEGRAEGRAVAYLRSLPRAEIFHLLATDDFRILAPGLFDLTDERFLRLALTFVPDVVGRAGEAVDQEIRSRANILRQARQHTGALVSYIRNRFPGIGVAIISDADILRRADAILVADQRSPVAELQLNNSDSHSTVSRLESPGCSVPEAAVAREPQGSDDGSTIDRRLMGASVGSFPVINEGRPLPLPPNVETIFQPAAGEGANGSRRAAVVVAAAAAAGMEGDERSSSSAGTAGAAQNAARAFHDNAGDEIGSVGNLEPVQVHAPVGPAVSPSRSLQSQQQRSRQDEGQEGDTKPSAKKRRRD